MITKEKMYVVVNMLLYEIADDVHWLMLTDVKHIIKSVLCAQSSFVRSLMPPMSKQRI